MKIVFIIILIHYVADYICQDGKWALGKSKNWKDLLNHTLTYSLIWLIPIAILFPNNWSSDNYVINSLLFGAITFITHTIIDYFSSRIASDLRAKGKFGGSIPNLGFFSVLGFDQVLHYGQLFLTYSILKNIIWI